MDYNRMREALLDETVYRLVTEALKEGGEHTLLVGVNDQKVVPGQIYTSLDSRPAYAGGTRLHMPEGLIRMRELAEEELDLYGSEFSPPSDGGVMLIRLKTHSLPSPQTHPILDRFLRVHDYHTLNVVRSRYPGAAVVRCVAFPNEDGPPLLLVEQTHPVSTPELGLMIPRDVYIRTHPDSRHPDHPYRTMMGMLSVAEKQILLDSDFFV